MNIKINIIAATLIITLAFGITVYAHGPNSGNQTPYNMAMGGGSMMGGGGMMGGSGSGHGMMGGYGHNGNGYNSRNYRQDDPNVKAETESLMDEIEVRRKELSSLLHSKNADRALIDQKVEELNRLERYLDERLQ